MKIKLILLLTGFILIGNVAQGAFLTDWTAADVFYWSDPVDPWTVSDPLTPNPSGADIVGWHYRLDGGSHYWRLDMLTAPTTGNAAPEYSLQFDSGAGGASRTDTGYVPHVLTGINEMVVAHFADATGVWTAAHRHSWDGVSILTQGIETQNGVNVGGIAGSVFQSTEVGGTALEWQLPVASMGAVSIYGTWGATYDINKPFGGTFDLTSQIPEPTTALLFGLVGGLAVFRRPTRRG